jgi:hypothetical protein
VNLWTAHWKNRALNAEEKQAHLEAAVECVRELCALAIKIDGPNARTALRIREILEQKKTP